jgi:hypothetical protein
MQGQVGIAPAVVDKKYTVQESRHSAALCNLVNGAVFVQCVSDRAKSNHLRLRRTQTHFDRIRSRATAEGHRDDQCICYTYTSWYR